MLAAVAFFALQSPASVTFDAFVDEMSKAVLHVTPGTWSMDVSDTNSSLLVTTDGTRGKIQYLDSGKPMYEYASSATSMTLVNHADKTYSQAIFPEVKKDEPRKLEPLEPLPEFQFDVKLDSNRGFVFRSNPPPVSARKVQKAGIETLVAKVLGSDGRLAEVRLTRDAKTKLPIQLRAPTTKKDKKMILDFKFVRRPVSPEELTIAPGSYTGYREIPPTTNPSGTL